MQIDVVAFGFDHFEEFDKDFAEETIWLGLRNNAQVVLEEFERLVEPWEHEKPLFADKRSIRGSDFVEEVYPDPSGDNAGYNKFVWLDDGTPERFYIMSDDFVRKSHPNSLDVNPGHTGNPTFTPFPQDGIEPRNWVILTVREHKDEIIENFQGIVDAIVDLFF